MTLHPLLKIGYFSQHAVEQLTKDGAKTTALAYFLKYFEDRGEAVVESEARACLGTFGLGGKVSSETPLTALSGGQKVVSSQLTALMRNIDPSDVEGAPCHCIDRIPAAFSTVRVHSVYWVSGN